MKRILFLFGLIGMIGLIPDVCAAESPYSEIEIREVFSKLIVRDKWDREYSGQIKSEKGLEKFLKKYSLDLKALNVDFENQMLIFGVTNNISTRAFRFLKQDKLNSYVFDYYDTGIQYKLAVLNKGKTYSYMQMFLINKIDGISHIRVKNFVQDKLSIVYE